MKEKNVAASVATNASVAKDAASPCYSDKNSCEVDMNYRICSSIRARKTGRGRENCSRSAHTFRRAVCPLESSLDGRRTESQPTDDSASYLPAGTDFSVASFSEQQPHLGDVQFSTFSTRPLRYVEIPKVPKFQGSLAREASLRFEEEYSL